MSVLDRPTPENELSEQEIIERANIAVRLLEEPVMVEAWDEVERLLLLKSLQADTVEGREDARRSVLLVESVKTMLTETVGHGQFAARPR